MLILHLIVNILELKMPLIIYIYVHTLSRCTYICKYDIDTLFLQVGKIFAKLICMWCYESIDIKVL